MEIGDKCNKDFDGDGVSDFEDSCDRVANIQRTSFLDHFIVAISGATSVWKISNKVNYHKFRQFENRYFVIIFGLVVQPWQTILYEI